MGSALGTAGCHVCSSPPLLEPSWWSWSSVSPTLPLLHPRKWRWSSALCSTDTNTGFSVCLFFLLFYVMWIPSPVQICTMVLIYLVTILYWEGIFKKKKLWFKLNFFFLLILLFKTKPQPFIHTAVSSGPGEAPGQDWRWNKWGFYIISVCIWYINQYLYKFIFYFLGNSCGQWGSWRLSHTMYIRGKKKCFWGNETFLSFLWDRRFSAWMWKALKL